MIDFLSHNEYTTLTKFRMGAISSVLGAIRKRDVMFSIDLNDAYFQILIHVDSQPHLWIALDGKVYIQGSLFCPFHRSPFFFFFFFLCKRTQHRHTLPFLESASSRKRKRKAVLSIKKNIDY